MAPRALTLREGIAPVRDRLLMTIFLAAVLHGVVILGLTFGSAANGNQTAPGLEVLLVSDEVPEAQDNDAAAYLAQRSQLGAGNSDKPVPPRNRASSRSSPGQQGDVDGEALGARSSEDRGGGERVLATTAWRAEVRYVTDLSLTSFASNRPLLVEERLSSQPADEDETGPVKLRGPRRDELWITPDSREAILAPYLDAWRRKVERIGTVNYPGAARRTGVKASPVLEVAIAADGRLEAAVIRRSSGYADLDQAALEILKLASPFDPFPGDLARAYRRLRFSYEWQFVGGRAEAGTLATVP